MVAISMAGFADEPVKHISTDAAKARHGNSLKSRAFIVFPELREKPLKWFDSIPEGKIEQALKSKDFELQASPGEFFVFQLGLWAINASTDDVQVEFSDLKGRNAGKIDAARIVCFNMGGTDYKGNPLKKQVNVPAGRVQPLWLGVDLEGIGAGRYSGKITIIASGKKQALPVSLKVEGEYVKNHGYDQGNRLSRLNWLNSTVGIDDEITRGYAPVTIEGNKITILGRTVTIAGNGLPAEIISHFGPSNQTMAVRGEPVTNKPFRFIIEKDNGEMITLTPGNLIINEKNASRVVWTVQNSSEEVDLTCTGSLEFDGFGDYQLSLTARKPIRVRDIRLEIPVKREKAEYMMGLGHEGGYRTPDWKWQWDVTKNQDMLWVGAVNGGIRMKWKAENYVRPLVNIYYEFGPLNLPPSWGNGGKGGVNVSARDNEVLVTAYSGNRDLKAGEKLNFDFELLITPFRLIDKAVQFNDRYYHGGGTNTSLKVEKAEEAGANIINIHHAEDIYPFINYPYLDDNVDELTRLVANAHKAGKRMKFYYTTRELTKNLPEFWALYSLNGEVIFPGPGNATRTEALHPKGPNEWLIKNLREKYIPAWYNIIKEGKFKGENDLSVITTPDSRLNNFYIAGLDWMVHNMSIDGVYIDDSALDRFTLRRARKIIDNSRPAGRIDLHSWNHFNSWAGFANCLNIYMDMLPYFDLVWIGEGRHYDRLPDHWLIEVSGIPFGLPGQMLEGGGNPWRGMVYGITNRAGWTRNPPSHLWRFFDEYNFTERQLMGYWEKNCPVKTGNPNLAATLYKGKDDIVLAIGNWSPEKQNCNPEIDWNALGLDPAKCRFTIPGIPEFQEASVANSLQNLEIEGGKGLIVVLAESK